MSDRFNRLPFIYWCIQTIRSVTDRAIAGLLKDESQEVQDLGSLDISTLTSKQALESDIKYMETYSKMVNQRLANQCRQFNSLQPIYQIPEEVLLKVISFVLERAVAKCYYFRDLHRLASVSFGWAALIKNSPSLWAVARSVYPAPAQSLALKKSKDSALEVVCKAAEVIRRNPDFIDRVAVHLQRWGSAVLFVHTIDLIAPLCASSAPLLNDLTIRVNSDTSDRPGVVMDLFGGKAERLRHLALERCWIPWDSGILSGLETLDLMNMKCQGPSLPHFISVLKSSPNLTTFRIQQFHIWADEDDEINPIELGSLKSCTIVGVNNLTTRSLLACIRAPACSSLVVDYFVRGNELHVALAGWFPSIRSMLKLSTQVYVEITGLSLREGFFLSLRALSGVDTILDISLKKQRSSEPLEALLLHVAETATLVPTWINVNIDHSAALPLPGIIAICTHFPALSHIQIHCRDMAESFVEYMSHPLDLDGTLSWPFR
ncbi:hypothetical protein FRB94_010816 [Tulasnella sp. JGI-2019a]|nr:hypothetical protein FRB94_010816 [Tulasnella sp. JGI-2019a]KAG9032439.1 hypothetical protein FRB95_001492 [Tulasnella sp. JGI-2019a]